MTVMNYCVVTCCKDNICITQLTDKSNHVKHLQSSPKSCKRKDKLKQVVRSNHMSAKQQVYDDTQNSTLGQNIQHLTNNNNNEETKTTSKSANHQSTAEHLNNTETCSSDNFSTFGLTKKGLRIGNLNVCHLVPKIDEINMLLHERRTVDILGICETFLNDETNDSLIHVDGFELERKDRIGNSGGGVILYISNKYTCTCDQDVHSDSTRSALRVDICARCVPFHHSYSTVSCLHVSSESAYDCCKFSKVLKYL